MNKRCLPSFRFFFFLILVGCAQTVKLGLERPVPFQRPTKIIWLQIAGLSTDHLLLLKVPGGNSSNTSSFERSLCYGQTWGYNLTSLRPDAQSHSMAQITGKKSMQGSCADYTHAPIWSYLQQAGYRTGVYENRPGKTSLARYYSCGDVASEYLENTPLWIREQSSLVNAPSPKIVPFFTMEQGNWQGGQIYADQSCNRGRCSSEPGQHLLYLIENFFSARKNSFFLIRDFSYQRALKSNPKKAASRLESLERLVSTIDQVRKADTLFVVSSFAPQGISFPAQGKKWKAFLNSQRAALGVNNELLAPVFAFGARSQNFCGIYDEAEIFIRLIKDERSGKLPFQIVI